MNGLSHDEILKYLSIIQMLRQSFRFYDMHVHPYEILFDKFTYNNDPSMPEILSMAGKSYTAPSITKFQFPGTPVDSINLEPSRLQGISLIQLGRTYGYVGEQVFIDQMNLSGIDKVLLLPVATDSGDCDVRMRWVRQIYKNQDKFLLAGTIPGSLNVIDMMKHVAELKNKYDIKAIKCHPVVSGIDLSSRTRREWLEVLLASCHESALPLVIHAGKNIPFWGGERGDFSSLENMAAINWSISSEPVVLAHAGFHRCSLNEIGNELLPLLKKMLGVHSNLYIDISDIGFEPLKLVLRSIDADRIIFGSDALYVSQWGTVAMTMHALQELGMNVEECFVRIASINPQKIIFKDR